jgi:AcrR family transcriptional regulator
MDDQKLKTDKDQRRDIIIDVAKKVFLEEGFDGASMSMISASLGGSKGTLYNYFRSKEELFEAFVQQYCLQHGQAMQDLLLADHGFYREALTQWAEAHLSMISNDENMRNFRVIVSVCERHPRFGHLFYENGPKRGAERLAGFLSVAEKDGEFTFKDTLQAAYQFIGLFQNRYLKARYVNYLPQPTEADVKQEVEVAVDTFYKAFGKVTN